MSVRITQPNGGEVLTVGNTYRITWDSTADLDTVTLGYKSCESCLSWIANGIPNTGYYDWNVFVGNTINTQFQIYILAYDTGVGSVSDVSDNTFSVLQPTPTPTFTYTPFPTATSIPSNTPTSTPPNSFPSTSVLDNFNRTNGAIGTNWSGYTGAFSIASNQLDVTNSGRNTSILWKTSSFGADQEAYFTFAQVDTSSNEQSLILKSQSSSGTTAGLIRVLYDGASRTVQVWTYQPAQDWVQYGAAIPVTFAAGDQLGARARPDGTVEVYKNGTLLGTRTITSWPYYASGGYIGLWMVSASNALLDNFGGGTR
jgi:hypothetical protein